MKRPGGFTPREAKQARRLGVVIALVGTFFVLELAGAVFAESVVLQADALHLLMDVLALGANLMAMRIAVREPTPRFTYGLRRAEPVAALLGALLILGTTAFIVAEGLEALRQHSPPKTGWMVAVAVMALFVNGASAWLLHDAIGGPHHPGDHARHGHGHGHALNLRSAWLHMVGDTLGAVAALAAGLTIRFGGPVAADPIASFLVAGILVVGALRLIRAAALVLLEAAPPHLPVATLHEMVVGFPGVADVRELHVWTLGAGHDAVTVHVRTLSRDAALGERLCEHLKTTLGVEYVTVQVEVSGEAAR